MTAADGARLQLYAHSEVGWQTGRWVGEWVLMWGARLTDLLCNVVWSGVVWQVARMSSDTGYFVSLASRGSVVPGGIQDAAAISVAVDDRCVCCGCHAPSREPLPVSCVSCVCHALYHTQPRGVRLALSIRYAMCHDSSKNYVVQE